MLRRVLAHIPAAAAGTMQSTVPALRGDPDPRARSLAVGAAGVACAPAVAALIVVAGPLRALVAVVAATAFVAVVVRPEIGAYTLITTTPLLAGIDRGALLPALRPSEALLLLVAAAIALRAALDAPAGHRLRLRPSRIDLAILLVALTSSIVPLIWMTVRHRVIERDDVLYAIMVWKYYGVFIVFRLTVRALDEVRRCLWCSMISAAIVAVLAIMEALQLFGMQHILSTLYAPYGNVTALTINRGGSTLGLPIAVADLMILNLAIAAGLLARGSRRRRALLVLMYLFVAGVFAAGEFSGVIGLGIAAVTLTFSTRTTRYLGAVAIALPGAALLLWPVIERRLQGFQSASGLPMSWEGRLHNLQTFFWPELFSGNTWLLGVRPAARVATETMATGYIWIESGYTWLLWAGGLPLLLATLYFFWVAGRGASRIARRRADEVGAAALSVMTTIVVIAVLMVLDPHLTYRGSADLLFALLGLTVAGASIPARDAAR
jgi:hypothetical protein